MTVIYVEGRCLSIKRRMTAESPTRTIYDFGAGLTFKRVEFRMGALYKYRKSTSRSGIFYYGGVTYHLFGGQWKLGW